MELTIVVGTGRCGSTLLSRILHEHPDVLSMSEFFGIARLAGNGLPDRDMTGEQFWQLLARPFPMLDALITAGLRTAEMIYHPGRFRAETGIPLISHFTLPLLTGDAEDPDGLFDELARTVPRWPRRPAAEQYLALFGYLARGRRVVVERSAASLYLIGALHRLFPAARFVHLYRDGPDCALSMSRHPVFRRQILAAAARRATGLPASATPQQVNAALPERLRGMICPPYDAGALMGHPIPVPVFGRDIWSPMVCAGAAALRALPPGSWTQLGYEDLLRDPVTALGRLAAFVGVTAPRSWLDAAESLIKPMSRTTLADPDTLSALRAACEPGMRALQELKGRA